MATPDDDSLFDGGEHGLGCHAFLRMVRIKALEAGRENDDVWVAHYAAACLDGPAIHWFEKLDDAVQESWKHLRRALLARWAPDPSPSAPIGSGLTPSPRSPTSRFA